MTADLDRALLAWPLEVSLITTFGTAGFMLLATGGRVLDYPLTPGRLLLLWRVLAGVTFLAALLVLLNLTADMGGVSWRRAVALVAEVVTETHAGHVFEWLLPLALMVLLAACVSLPYFIRTFALLILSGVLLFLQALLSHAIDKGALAVTVYFLHEVSAALWVGALLAFWMVAQFEDPPCLWVKHGAQRVSRTALCSVIALVITGTYTAYNGLGLDLYRLLFSVYGRTLVAKVAIFAGVLAIGAYNRFWLVPRIDEPGTFDVLMRNILTESVILLLAVLGLAVLLANTPPAHGMGGNSGHSMMAMFSGDAVRRRLRKLVSKTLLTAPSRGAASTKKLRFRRSWFSNRRE